MNKTKSYSRIILFLMVLTIAIPFFSNNVKSVKQYNPLKNGTEPYYQSTDENNPFTFIVDVPYVPINDSFNWDNSSKDIFYHQVYLFSDKIYVFYFGTDTEYVNCILKSSNGQLVFNETNFNYDAGGGMIVFNIPNNGYYNLTIDLFPIGYDSGGSMSCHGIGFFEVKELVLNEIRNGIGFSTDPRAFGYYPFDKNKNYTASNYAKAFLFDDSISPNSMVLKEESGLSLNSSFTFDLDPLHKMIIYESYQISPISEVPENEQPKSIAGFNQFIIPIIAISILILVNKIKKQSD
ncbi:MAG: hypothetical protein ACTSU2_03775 [Promethearchaeota archaeon]